MKIFGLDIRRIKKDEEQRSYYFNDALNFSSVYNRYSAMNVSAVYRAVEIISDSIAMLPIKVKTKEGQHHNVMEGHPVELAIYDKYGTISKFTLMKLLIQSVMLRGNGYALIERAEDGTVKAIKYIPSENVLINYNPLKPEQLFYQISGIKGRIEPVNMIHLVKNTYDGVNGISVLQFGARAIDLANNTENSANGFFENGCNLAGILTVQGQLTDKQKEDIRTSWGRAYSNGGSGLAVLQGNMSYQQVQMNSKDSQLLESRQFNVQDIARFFGISPTLLGDLSHSSYNTIEATQQQFLLHTLQPYIVMVEEEFNRKLLKPSEADLFIDLDETALLKSDKNALASYYGSLIDRGILCINEVRKELGYAPIDGGDRHIIAFTDISQNTINKEEIVDKDGE